MKGKRKLSATARKAISERMRKYWAGRRKNGEQGERKEMRKALSASVTMHKQAKSVLTKQQIKRLAAMGAESRMSQLAGEMRQLMDAFPEVRETYKDVNARLRK